MVSKSCLAHADRSIRQVLVQSIVVAIRIAEKRQFYY